MISLFVDESIWNIAPGLFALNFRKVLLGKLTVLFPVNVPSELYIFGAKEALTAFKTYEAVVANEALTALLTLFTVRGNVLPSPLVNVKVALDTEPVTNREPVLTDPPNELVL